MKIIKITAALALLWGVFGSVQAAIVSGSATVHATAFEILNPVPASVGSDDFNTNILYGFNERQGLLLQDALTVGGQTIASGQRISSHYIFWDPAVTRTAFGQIFFDGIILAVATATQELIDTDSLLGVTSYTNTGLRGLEAGDDWVLYDENVLSVYFKASTPGDYVRVITASPVPVPAALWLFGSGLVGLIGFNRRRKQTG